MNALLTESDLQAVGVEYACRAYMEGYQAVAARHSEILVDTAYAANTARLADMYEVLGVLASAKLYYRFHRAA